MRDLLLAVARPTLGNNLTLAVFLATCLYLGAAMRVRLAQALAGEIVLIVLAAAALAAGFDAAVLARLGLEYLSPVVLTILVVALVQLAHFVRYRRQDDRPKGFALPRIAAAYSVLVASEAVRPADAGFLVSLLHAAGAALGFAAVLILYAGIRERLDLSPVPARMRGLPLALLTIGLMATAFLGIQQIIQ